MIVEILDDEFKGFDSWKIGVGRGMGLFFHF